MHSADTSFAPFELRRPHLTSAWRAPGPYPDRPVFRRAQEIVVDRTPGVLSGRRSFLHSDFNPGNVLWLGTELTGVVDWSVSRLGRVGWDVAYCRSELVLLTDRDNADRFLRDYEAAAGAVEPANL